MRLLKARFHNWCQHRDLTVDLSDGLNAIRGPNGSGKSNILTGIVFGLTGDFSRNPGVKVDNIYQLAGDKEKAGVSLELIHGATRLTIDRNLRPNSQKLVIDGVKEPITKADDINLKVQELLGVNERLLLDYVFVDQWKIFAFVDQSPTVRAKAFGELFNAMKAESLWKLLGDFKIDVPVPSIDGDRVRVRIAETKNEIGQLQEELAKYNYLPEKWTYADDPLRTVVLQHVRKTDIGRNLTRTKELMVSTQQQIDSRADFSSESTTKLFEWRRIIVEIRDEAEQAKVDLASWNAYETANKARAMLENEVQQLTKERDAKLAPDKPHDYCGPHYHEHEERLATMRSEIATYNKLLTTFDAKSGVANCPTCGTSTSQLQGKLQEAYMGIETLRTEAAALRSRITISREYDNQLAQFTEWISHNKSSLHIAEVRLISLGVAGRQLTKDQDQLKQLVDDYKHARDIVTGLEETTNAHDRELAQLRGKHSLLNGQVAVLQLEYDGITVTEKQALDAGIQLSQMQENITIRSNLRFKLATKMRLLKDDEAALLKFQLNERKAVKLRRLASHFDDVRGICKELPQVAAQACLDSMVEEINDVLERFDAPFRVLNVDNLKFTLKKHSGVTMYAERLSGGEKAVFALAFRIVVNSRFAGSLGLLCLDEPTAGLDEDNVACLEVALGRLRELSTSRGLQVILITHETGLDGLFDRVIKLSPTL